MGLLELIIVLLLILWLLGYFGRGRVYARGPALDVGGSGNWIHVILVIVLVLVLLRLLGR